MTDALKILLIGQSKVGKSCIILRFCEDTFKPNSGSTIGVDFKFVEHKVDQKVHRLQVWDTAGQERFRTITSTYYRNMDGVLVVYDITDQNSFEQVTDWVKEIRKHAPIDICMVLVGNKSDLNGSRKVTQENGKNLAEFLNCPFIETSAKTGTNVSEGFTTLTRAILKIKSEKGEQQKKKVRSRKLKADQPQKKACC
ncbi:ras and ef-hand domain-containing protein [Anaeramoeba flamelloides]|uniref:Ras and ef-hand domain-containing protein n=1 Tax=Anaeramoeba flamelloides TaxID=1746091 RepID=A0AAV7YRX8_9EUKA|nr:ras and ef-hand domain-containing protein [Anaeramoeba flamelloides]